MDNGPWDDDLYQDEEPYQDGGPYEEDAYGEQPIYDDVPYEEPEPVYDEPPALSEPEIVSTSQAINLTATLASLSALFALFLCFADQRSRAVRRFAVQSVGLGAVQLAVALICWLLDILLGWVPFIGGLFHVLVLALFLAAMGVALYLRVRMMTSAYRGVAHALPVIGGYLRKYE